MTPRIVLDTNVLISAIVFGGKPREVLSLVLRGRARLGVSWPLLDELRDVLVGRKFGYSRDAIRMILSELEDVSTLIGETKKIYAVKADPADNRVLECAVAFEADAVVSGDEHLLVLGRYAGILILPPAGYLSSLKD